MPPYRRSGSKVWYVKITNDGKTTRRSTGTADREEAEKIEKEWRKSAPTHSWDEAMSLYLQDKPTERAAYAIKAMRYFFAGKSIEHIQPKDIARYKRERQAAPGTQKKELGVMRAAIRHCRLEYGWQVEDPTRGRMPDIPPPRVRWLTREEYDRLIQAARSEPKAPHLAPFIQLAVNTGMRRNELLQLRWQDVSLDSRLVHLAPKQQKNRRYSTVPLNQAALDALHHLGPGDGRVFQVDAVKRSFRTACRRAGISDFRIHDLRHTCAAWLVQAGVPIRTVADILRHADIKTTMRYAHLSADSARSGVDALVVQNRLDN